MSKLNQRGVVPAFLLLAALGLLTYIFVANTFSFRDKLFNFLYPKPRSQAADSANCTPAQLTKFSVSDNCPAKNFKQAKFTCSGGNQGQIFGPCQSEAEWRKTAQSICTSLLVCPKPAPISAPVSRRGIR